MNETENNGKIILDNNAIITKANRLSLANLESPISLKQAQLLSLAILKFRPEELESTITLKEFSEYSGVVKYLKRQAVADSDAIQDLKFVTVDDDFLNNDTTKGKRSRRSIVIDTYYQDGVLTFEWNPKVLPLLTNLEGYYMMIDMSITKNFSSVYSWILYEFLKINYNKRNIKHCEIDVDKLKGLFNVRNKSSYNNFSVFAKATLDVAVDEINRFSEMDLKYNKIRKGKKITAIDLVWSIKQTEFSLTTKQMSALENLSEELNHYESFRHKDKYMKLREIMKSDYRSLTKKNANAIIFAGNKALTELDKAYKDMDILDPDFIFQTSEDEENKKQGVKVIFSEDEIKPLVIELLIKDVGRFLGEYFGDIFFSRFYSTALKTKRYIKDNSDLAKYISNGIANEIRREVNDGKKE